MHMLAYLVELIGTFIFVAVILISGSPIAIGITLTAMIFFGTKISGGHFNPAVAYGAYLSGSLNGRDLIGQIIAQFIGAYLAYIYSLQI